MIWLYRLLFFPLLLLTAPYYLRRMWRRGGYGAGFSQRFGAVPPLPPRRPGVRRLWLQAVSVGELLAVGPLLEAWQRDPGIEVYLTTTTSTGYTLAQARYATQVLALGYFPLDGWPVVRRAWRRIAPDALLLMEGERWPEHLHEARRRRVPVLALNARLSDRSFRRLTALRPLVPALFGGLTRILACSREDADRFLALGYTAAQVRITGNLKLDVTLPLPSADEQARWRAQLGLADAPVLIGASTWPGEEAALFAAWQTLRDSDPMARLLLVPRHAERRDELEAWLRTTGVSYHLRSRGPAPGPVEVLVADTTGELRALLPLARVAFIGKSLPPHREGQTPVEAAGLGVPTIFGPGMGNFRALARDLLAHRAAVQVATVEELTPAVQALWSDAAARAALSTAARAWQTANQGAVQRTLDQLAREWPAAA